MSEFKRYFSLLFYDIADFYEGLFSDIFPEIANIIASGATVLLYGFLSLVITILSPIWVVPYIIWRKSLDEK